MKLLMSPTTRKSQTTSLEVNRAQEVSLRNLPGVVNPKLSIWSLVNVCTEDGSPLLGGYQCIRRNSWKAIEHSASITRDFFCMESVDQSLIALVIELGFFPERKFMKLHDECKADIVLFWFLDIVNCFCLL